MSTIHKDRISLPIHLLQFGSSLVLALFLLICLTGCQKKPAADPAIPPSGETNPVISAGESLPVPETGETPLIPPETAQSQAESAAPAARPDRQDKVLPAQPGLQEDGLRFDQFSLFTGQFVEDGRDELVEDAAAILVTNTTDRFLDLATIAFEIDDKVGAFVVTGLPAGRSAWVLEMSGLRAEADASVNYLDCISSFRDDVQAAPPEIQVTAEGNMLTVRNRSDHLLEGVSIYYRTVHSDGNFLGGITYVVEAGDLKPGSVREVLAGHYDEACSEIVRIGWKNQSVPGSSRKS